MKFRQLFRTRSTLLLLIIILFCGRDTTYAQELSISKLTLTKSFDLSGYFELGIDKNKEGSKECCNTASLFGYIADVRKDHIVFNLVKGSSVYKSASLELSSLMIPETGNSELNIPKEDVALLRYFKSKKHAKRKEAFLITGGLLLFTGIATTIHYFILGESENKNRLLYSGGIQCGLGIGLLISSNTKSYKFKHTSDPWQLD